MKDLLETFVAIAFLAGITYNTAKIEERIVDLIQEIRKDLAVHITEYVVKGEWIDYMLHALDEKISHRISRLRKELKRDGEEE